MSKVSALVDDALELLDGFGTLILGAFGFLLYWGIITTPFQLLWPGEEPNWLWWTLFLAHVAALVVWVKRGEHQPHRFLAGDGQWNRHDRCLMCGRAQDAARHTA